MAKYKLDLGHGFLKHIIKNQEERDNYDKEVKSTLDRPKQKSRKKDRRPDMNVYVLPKDRKKQLISNQGIHNNHEKDSKDKHETLPLNADGDVKEVTNDLNSKLKLIE